MFAVVLYNMALTNPAPCTMRRISLTYRSWINDDAQAVAELILFIIDRPPVVHPRTLTAFRKFARNHPEQRTLARKLNTIAA